MRCFYCTADNATKLCSACQILYYCSRNCQTKHWKSHKKRCKKLKESKIINKFKLPVKYVSNLVQINDHEFITTSQIIFDKSLSNKDGIYKFNTDTNKWTLCVQYACTSRFKPNQHSICYNKSTNMLYSISSNNFCTINMKTGSCNRIAANTRGFCRPYLLMIKDEINIINGSSHYIFHTNTQTLQQIYQFSTTITTCIHLPSKNILLAFGSCSIKKKSKNKSHLKSIWIYKISLQHWSQTNISLPFASSCIASVLSSDEQHIILFGATNICIIEVFENKLIFYYSHIRLPAYGEYTAINIDSRKSKDNMLVFGFTRRCISMYNINIPNELIEMVLFYYTSENVHLLRYGTGIHYELRMKDIIESKKSQCMYQISFST
eukprot:219949_1